MKIKPIVLSIALASTTFTTTMALAEEDWMDNSQWVLDKIVHGHYSKISEDAVATGNMTVTPNVSQDSSLGDLEIISKGFEYGWEGLPCEETYIFSWDLSDLQLNLVDDLHVNVEAFMTSTLGDKIACPGSQDGTFVAMGSRGIVSPMFIDVKYWVPPTALGTTGSTDVVYGWSNFYPQQAEGDLSFPEAFVIQENYPEYASIQLVATVSSNVAPGVITYSVVYIFKHTSLPPQDVDPDGRFPIFYYIQGGFGGAVD